MEKIQLSLLYTLQGVGSASGILCHRDTLLIIGDNSSYLYEYHVPSQQLYQHPLNQNAAENIPKIDKPDLEAITQYGDYLYIFGSGSTQNRNILFQVHLQTKTVVKTIDISRLYHNMQAIVPLTPENFNIEGAIALGDRWLFFQRGNGKNGTNILFTVTGHDLEGQWHLSAHEITLPELHGIPTGFTDAIAVENKIYFLASAEDTVSTYDDGEVVGTIIGRIDLNTRQLDFTQKISDTLKLEGLTLYKKTSHSLEFLLCEDNDTEIQESKIFLLQLAEETL